MINTGSVIYGKERISFEVLYVPRKTLEIAVLPDKRVVVRAPLKSEWSRIEARVKKRARWIKKQILFFRQFEPRSTARNYVSGEIHLYLGRKYRLKINIGQKPEVKLIQGRILVTPQNTKPEKVRDCLESWYRERAGEKFSEIFEQCMESFRRMGLECPKMRIRKMRKRWGSLSERGALTLNLKLIHTPKECIEYVIAHELCHLKFHNHRIGFYEMLGRIIPDWQKRKERLEYLMG